MERNIISLTIGVSLLAQFLISPLVPGVPNLIWPAVIGVIVFVSRKKSSDESQQDSKTAIVFAEAPRPNYLALISFLIFIVATILYIVSMVVMAERREYRELSAIGMLAAYVLVFIAFVSSAIARSRAKIRGGAILSGVTLLLSSLTLLSAIVKIITKS